jgi:hypothetical protein
VKIKSAKGSSLKHKPTIIQAMDGEVDAILYADIRLTDAKSHASSITKRITRIVDSYIGQPNTKATHIEMTNAIEAELGLRVPGLKILDGQVGKDDQGLVNIGMIIEQPPYVKELKYHLIIDDRIPKPPVKDESTGGLQVFSLEDDDEPPF